MPRKTDVNNPLDWLVICESDLVGIALCAAHEVSDELCRSKLAEVLEKRMKAELVRLGWSLKKTHELEVLTDDLRALGSEFTVECEPLSAALAEAYFSDRYVGFDLEDPDWPALRAQLEDVTTLAARIRDRLAVPPP